jgi:homogentisate 1,2-dioxygenase
MGMPIKYKHKEDAENIVKLSHGEYIARETPILPDSVGIHRGKCFRKQLDPIQ